MKKLIYIGLGALTLGVHLPVAHAQRAAPSRDDRRQQRQQEMENMTPEQRQQYMQQRFQERLQNASPEQRQRMLDARANMEANMKAQGLDPKDPNAWQQAMQQARGGNRGGNGAAGAPTAAQREAQQRQLMAVAGINDKDTQDAIIAFIRSEEEARQPLLKLARAAAATLTPATPAVTTAAATTADGATNGAQAVPAATTTDTPVTATPAVAADPVAAAVAAENKINDAFTAYQTALDADKTRHTAALQELDAKVSYSTNPRLKSFLTLVGVLDNDALMLGGAPAIFSPASDAANAGQGRGGNAGNGNAAGNAGNGNAAGNGAVATTAAP